VPRCAWLLHAAPVVRRRRRHHTGSALAWAALVVGGCAGNPIDSMRHHDGGASQDGGVTRSVRDGSGPAPASDAASLPDAPEGLPCVGDAVVMCATSCGSIGTRACTGSVFGPCTAPSEECNGRDDDCDGSVDEAIATRACSTACGAGEERCEGGAWGGCTATSPSPEICNGADDDCDSRIDEGIQAVVYDPVPMAELTARHPGCTGPSAPIDNCMSASSRWCNAQASGCFDVGAGLLQAVPDAARVACFTRVAALHDVSYAEVSAASRLTVNSTTVRSRVAQAAVNRYCRSLSMAAGIGPVEWSDGRMTLFCLPPGAATIIDVPTAELVRRGCDPIARDPSVLVCSSASDLVCRERGQLGGYGPVEWNPTSVSIVCF